MNVVDEALGGVLSKAFQWIWAKGDQALSHRDRCIPGNRTHFIADEHFHQISLGLCSSITFLVASAHLHGICQEGMIRLGFGHAAVLMSACFAALRSGAYFSAIFVLFVLLHPVKLFGLFFQRLVPMFGPVFFRSLHLLSGAFFSVVQVWPKSKVRKAPVSGTEFLELVLKTKFKENVAGVCRRNHQPSSTFLPLFRVTVEGFLDPLRAIITP